jgi:molybdopterin/thiamine biosynthesis adenylyltransferase
MKAREKHLEVLKSRVTELSVVKAHELFQRGALLVDIRESDEVSQASPAGALRISKSFLELRLEDHVEDETREICLLCAGGVRSLFAADSLLQMGYRKVYSVSGGFAAWKAAGLPVETPRMLKAREKERYGRHLLLPEVGEAGQLELLGSRVLIVGAGGLGSPVAMYLAGAGVGGIGLVDDDVVDRSNLQRQILHRDASVGEKKVDSARQTLLAYNPDIHVETYAERLTGKNVERIFEGWDIVVDGTDNFPTRYLVNDACVRLKLPNVHGAIQKFEGQVSVFWPASPNHRQAPCYRCLYPEAPPPELAPSCAEAGVLGVLPGIVGLWEAVEVIKLILGIGEPLIGKVLHYDALASRVTTLKVAADATCPLCSAGASFPGYPEMQDFCRA